MARRMALSKMITQPAVLTRSGTGLALTFNTAHQINAPTIEKYGFGYQPYDNFPTKQWCLVVQDADTTIDPSVTSDPDIRLLPAGWTMSMTLSASQRNAANTALSATDLGVMVVTGQTVKQMIAAILVALNHSPQAEEWIFL